MKTPVSPDVSLFNEQIQIIIEEKVPIFSFTFGVLDEILVQELHKNNTILIGTVTNVEEAEILANDKIDFLVAQGSEAGGHRATFYGDPIDHGLIGLMSLVPQIVDNVDTPIIAAGGIMDGRGINAAISLGAVAVQMGTAFLSCKESGISQVYRKCLLEATDDTTVLTKSFSGRYARCMYNHFIAQLQSYQDNILDFPIQNNFTKQIRKVAEQQNMWEYLALYSGQSAHLSTGLSAKELIAKLVLEINLKLI